MIAASNKVESKLLWELGLVTSPVVSSFLQPGDDGSDRRGGGYGLEISSGSDIFIQRQKTIISPVYTGILIWIEINPDSNLPIECELANPNSNPVS